MKIPQSYAYAILNAIIYFYACDVVLFSVFFITRR